MKWKILDITLSFELSLIFNWLLLFILSIEKDSAIAQETEYLQNECRILKIELEEQNKELAATKVKSLLFSLCFSILFYNHCFIVQIIKLVMESLPPLIILLCVWQDDLSEALDGLEAANRLSELLDRKEEALAALKEEGWYLTWPDLIVG